MNNIHKTMRTWQTPFGAPMLAILITLFSFGKANAQVAPYGFAASTGTYAPITGGTPMVLSATATTAWDSQIFHNDPAGAFGPVTAAGFPIGFPFTYNGVAYDRFVIGTDGWIKLGTGATFAAGGAGAIPISTGTGNTDQVIAGFGTNLVGGTGITGTRTTGSAIFNLTGTGIGAAGLVVAGMRIVGLGIPVGTTVLSITGNDITMSANATTTSTFASPILVAANNIRFETIGTVGAQTLVVQWSGVSRSSGFGDNLNFQIRLNQTGNTVQSVYGTMNASSTSTTSSVVQVGLKGLTNADYNNRTSATSWATTTAGTVNSAGVTYQGVGVLPAATAIIPASGTTYTWTPALPCSGAPSGGTAIASVTNACLNSIVNLSLTGNTTGVTGLTYSWESSPTGVTWTPLSPAVVTNTATVTITGPLQYRCVITCASSPLTGPSLPAIITINNATYATVPYTQNFEATWQTTCVTAPLGQDTPDGSWRGVNTTVDADASWRADNTTAALSGWSFFGSGDPIVGGANTTARYARFHSYGVSGGLQGSMDLYVNLSAAGTKTLTFSYVTPSPGIDQLELLLSTDGGATFAPLVTTPALAAPATAITVWTQVTATITATSATSVIRFRATGDFGNFDIGLDEVSITAATACPTITFANTTATSGTVGTAYTLNGSATAAPAGTLAYSVTPALPAGLAISATTGQITGTPTAVVASATYTVRAETSTTCFATQAYTFAINAAVGCPTITFTNTIAGAATTGAFYSLIAGATATSGTLAYAVSPALPTGLSINATTGAISGIPNTVTPSASYVVTASTSSTCSSTQSYTFAVNVAAGCPTITFANTVATAATIGTAYTLNASATATSGTLTYFVFPALPAGLALNAITGQITGTPTAVAASTTYVVTAATSVACLNGQSYTFAVNAVVVCPTITFANTIATVATVGTAYTLNASATATSGTLAYSVTPALPAGLTLSATTGQITGTPTAATASATYTVRAETSTTCFATQTYTFAVNAAVSTCVGPLPTFTLTPAVASVGTLVSATVDTPYSQQFTGAGLTGAYTYSISTPLTVLPTGLTFNPATGLLSGTPRISTSFTFAIRAINVNTCVSLPVTYSLVINPSSVTSIDNSLANSVKVSPNPSKGDFNVDFGTINMAKSSVRVYDAQGKVVFTSENNSNLMVISLDKFANGIYLMEVETSKGRVLKRLAKQ